MRAIYVVIAVVALLVGFVVGALAFSGDDGDENQRAATTRSETTSAGDATSTAQNDSTGKSSGEDGDGTELAPESANDPRPEAPDDVIGDRPGAGGDEDPGP